ncbi:metal-sensitive transcriptional regulator [Cellulomonas sp.]|uniref:metal-sensitive transcriptional regulator n=1 Tax=Cellulomonas sp. TaxID=40001 RepID=UPI0025C549DE|nr:metal-sensitive transcriptional regulator [Cellulomonas sp.]
MSVTPAPSHPAVDDPVTHDDAPVHGYTPAKDEYLRRLRRVEGQVRGIARMVDEDVYCIDVLTQIAAVTKALQAVGIGLVEDHLGHCVVDAARQSPEAGAEKVREASAAIARLVRS